MGRSLKILVLCNSSRFYKRQAIGSTCNILNPANSESQRNPHPPNPAKATETSKGFKYHSFNFPFFTIDSLIMAGKVTVRAAAASGR